MNYVSVVVLLVPALPLGRCVLVRLELKAWMELRGCMDAGMGERVSNIKRVSERGVYAWRVCGRIGGCVLNGMHMKSMNSMLSFLSPPVSASGSSQCASRVSFGIVLHPVRYRAVAIIIMRVSFGIVPHPVRSQAVSLLINGGAVAITS